MNKVMLATLIFMLAVSSISCSTSIDHYENELVPFDIKTYFNGPVVAWGMVEDYKDQVTRRFCVEIESTWQGNKGTLAEKFYFNDGEISYRNWQLTKARDGSYRGTAEDVEGTAIGVHKGFAFQFTYNLLLTLDGETFKVTMDDWMYQIDEHRVMNKTSMHKLGVNVANITLFFDKSLPNKQCGSEAKSS